MKNVVYIFCDELRQDALGCYGNPAGPMKTPNIDSIAQRGVLFENCFCNSPVCVPSRTSLLTGLYPEDTAVYHNEAALSTFSLPRKVTTFPEALAQAGYHTANFGKTHLPKQLHPFQLDVQDGSKMNMGLTPEESKSLEVVNPSSALKFNLASLYPEGKDYYPETVTHNALSWIAQQTEPFFVRVSYLQPHNPIILKRGYEKLYAEYPFSRELPDISQLSEFEKSFASVCGLESLTPEELCKVKAYYYGLTAWIDDQVGEILHLLEERELLENTVLIVNADHGALRGECRGLGKHLFQRASQAVPLIIADPDMSSRQRGSRVKQICSNIDLPRTLFGLLGVAIPEQFRGCDLFSGKYPQEVYGTIGYGEADSYAFPLVRAGRLPGNRGWPRRACIRTQRYRLDISSRIDATYTDMSNEDLFFVDTQVCPEENRNMAAIPEYATIVRRLRQRLREHLEDCQEVPSQQVQLPESTIAGL